MHLEVGIHMNMYLEEEWGYSEYITSTGPVQSQRNGTQSQNNIHWKRSRSLILCLKQVGLDQGAQSLVSVLNFCVKIYCKIRLVNCISLT